MTVQSALSFHHRFEAGDNAHPPLLLLHGTGGDEHDLIDLGRALSPGSALLSPRGKVLENGMPRFFRRLAEGVFDEDDLRIRALELADFIEEARAAYGMAQPIAVGFSNGANIAAALLMMRPETLRGAVLLRAMSPFAQPPKADLTGKSLFIASGFTDPLIPTAQADRLVAECVERGARVDHQVIPTGHNLSQADVTMAASWISHL